MKYTCEIDIDLPRSRTIELFDSSDNLRHWLRGLVSFTPKDGTPGQAGATADIVFQMGKRRVDMVETIETRNLPEEFHAVYTTQGVWNRTENYLTENSNGSTHWRQVNEFRCEGLMMRLMTTFLPFMFRKQTLMHMQDFKAFAEDGKTVND